MWDLFHESVMMSEALLTEVGLMGPRSICKLIALSLLCAGFPAPLANAQERTRLPANIQDQFAWLPTDTETLIVAQSFWLPSESGPPPVLYERLSLLTFAIDKRNVPWLSSLAKNKIQSVVLGSRKHEAVSSFGALRFEGCAMVTFESDLPEARKTSEQLAQAAASNVRLIAGRHVYEFPSSFVMEPWVPLAPWQRDFFVWLNDSVLLIATSDEYLTQVLDRIDHRSDVLALPADLPEWKDLDSSAPVWLLRHIPKKENQAAMRTLIGLRWQVMDRRFVVTYLTEKGQAEAWRQRMHKLWQEPDVSIKLVIDAPNDESVVVTHETLKSDDSPFGPSSFWLGFPIYWTQGQTDDFPGRPDE